MMKKILLLPLLLLAFTFTTLIVDLGVANAAVIKKVKGKKVLINLEGEPAKKGQTFYTIDSKGKKKGILKITKIKGEKAIARIKKGKAKKGWVLKYRPKKSKRAKSKKMTPEPEATADGRSYWGFMAGFASQSMDVKIIERDEETSMSGSGFSAKALMDYRLFQSFWFRGMLGMEQLSTSSGDVVCGDDDNNPEACKANITYLSADLWGRYLFSSGNMRPWVGLGFSLLFPMSKDTTALNDESITNTNVTALGGGLDWVLNPTTVMPIQIEYGMFPKSNQVTASYISVRVGVAFGF